MRLPPVIPLCLLASALAAWSADLQVLRNSPGIPLPADGIREVSAKHGSFGEIDGERFYVPRKDFVGADTLTFTNVDDGSERKLTIDVRAHPNFLFILADDQSWTCLSTPMDRRLPASASDFHRTPHLDRLAAEGMRFSRGYSPAPNCSPTRYADLTGKTCARLKFTDIVGRGHTTASIGQKLIPIDKATRQIRAEDTTIPELLKTLPEANYTTAHFGKWHLAGGGPEKHGFDTSDGPTGNGEGNRGPVIRDDPKLVFHIADRGNAFMSRAAGEGRPFYLQLSHYAVHAKIQHRAETLAMTRSWKPGEHHTDPAYAAMVADLDESVGRTLARLDELGLRHSTFVFYQADNGAPRMMSNAWPLKRFKPEIWEGGTRVPTLVRGPGIAPKSQSDQPVMGIDLLPTLWELAGGDPARLPSDLDGGSLVGCLKGNGSAPIERPSPLVVHSPHYVLTDDLSKNQRPSSAIHEGPWKLVAWYESGEVLLFNLTEDPTEMTDVSARHPAERLRLWRKLRDYLVGVDAQFPRLDPAFEANPGEAGDADADGLPDEWEMRHLLSFAFDPDDDPNGDGTRVGKEWETGTDPLARR